MRRPFFVVERPHMGVDLMTVWKVVKERLPKVKEQVGGLVIEKREL